MKYYDYNKKIIMNIDSDFIKSFSNILQEQNSLLLKRICDDYNWDFNEMYKLFIEENKFDFSNDKYTNVCVRNQWMHNGNNYYVEEGTNNVYLDGVFKGKKYDDELFSDCEET